MIELEVVPALLWHYGLGLIPAEPARGRVARRCVEEAEKEGRRCQCPDFEKSAVEAKREKLEAYEALCAKLGEEPAHVGLAWLLHQPRA